MTFAKNAASVLEVLNDALPASCRAYDLDKVPDPRPRKYVELSLSRAFGGNQRASGRLWPTGYRVSLGGISELSIDDVRTALEICTAALEGKRITVDDRKSTPVQFETDEAPESDNGRFSGYRVFTYVIRD